MASHVPAVSAVVCTRNRGASVVATVESILASDCADFEVLVVDQSSDESTQQALAQFTGDHRQRVVHSRTQGLGRARNIGLDAAAGDICCFTDDDCTVPPEWLRVMADVFRREPSVAVAFCNVNAGPYNPEMGFVPVYHRDEDRLFTRIREKAQARGIGAGLAVRKSLVQAMGGFDEMLGAGGVFPSCEDGDIAARALLMGHAVYECADTAVTHFGFRTWEQGRYLSKRDWEGVGAAYIKPLKCGRWAFLPVIAHEVWTWALLPPLRNLLRLRKPEGLSRAVYFMRGAALGLRTPVDKKTMRFAPNGRRPIEESGANSPMP
jgi:glycosyltransferase involved in cell wall biosynthesis